MTSSTVNQHSIDHELGRVSPKVRIASIFLLPDCDMVCPFCAADRDFSTMRRDQAEALLEGLADRGIRNVVFGGGEPLMWPDDLFDLASWARELGHFVQICTNGVALREGFTELPVDRWILPLEADDPVTHDRLRARRGGHHAIVRKHIDELVRAHRELSLSTVVTAENIAELPALSRRIKTFLDAGASINSWHLYRFLPVGRGGARHQERFSIELDHFRAAVDAVQATELEIPVYRRENMQRPKTVEFFCFDGENLRIGSS